MAIAHQSMHIFLILLLGVSLGLESLSLEVFVDNLIITAQLHHVVEHGLVDDPLRFHDDLHQVE